MPHTSLFVRIISKNREVYLLKTLTLAVAFASATLITLFALGEFGYDRVHDRPETVFRVLERNNEESFSGNRLSSKIPLPVYHRLAAKAGDSLAVARVKIMNGISVAGATRLHHDQKIHAADSSLLSVFSFEYVSGNFSDFSHGILLSERASLDYFGTTNSAGKMVKLYTLGDTLSYPVAAVFRDFPVNTHEAFTVFIPFTKQAFRTLAFDEATSGVYGRFLENTSAESETIFRSLKSDNLTYSFQPLPDIYFGPRVTGEDARHGDEYSIWILLCVTALILFLALTSFVNLTTLTLPHRSKELAIKKLSGTGYEALMRMFAVESFSIVGIAFVLGVLVLIGVNSFIEPVLQISTLDLLISGNEAFLFIAASLLLIAGTAPLLMASHFARATPTRLLSTDTITFPRFKRIITFLQLGTSIFLIVSSLVIRRQVNHSLIKEPGRNHYQVVYMPYPEGLTNEGLYELRNGWKKNNPNIQDVIATSQLPHYLQSKELNTELYVMTVDRGYREFFDLNVDSGRWFQANDNAPMTVVNKAGVEFIPPGDSTVIGVVETMSEEFNQPQKPVRYQLAAHTNYQFLCVRIMEVNIRTTMYVLSHAFSNSNPAPVSFVNVRFEEWLRYQDRLNALSEALTLISGVLSCLAIYGLSLSLVRDKLKQIAIHKLFGAGTVRITRMLAMEFVQQMGIAIVVFGPITYIFLNEFLRNFVYTTPFQWSDSVYPLTYCVLVIVVLCGLQALSLNRADLNNALKGN